MAERVPIDNELRHAKVDFLSVRQHCTVRFGRAMMIDPAPVFLGEPSVCLDAKSSRLVFETAIVLRDGGRSVLMVAQHVCSGRAVSAYGTVVALGVVRLTGKASEPLDDPELGQSYLRASTVHHRRPLDTEHALT